MGHPLHHIRTHPLVLSGSMLLMTLLCSHCTSKSVTAEYLGQYTVSANLRMLETDFGGISGIDYDPKRQLFHLISDDRSKHGLARMYQAKIQFGQHTIDSLIIKKVVFLSDEQGKPFAQENCDMESIRYITNHQQWIVGNEGGKLGQAGLYFMDSVGKITGSIPISKRTQNSLRFNKSFEGLSVSKDAKTILYTTEAPLISDGAVPTFTHGGLIRLIAIDLSGSPKKEWLYHLEKIPQKATEIPPWGATGSDNGLSELLYLGKNKFLTLERSGAYIGNGNFDYRWKLFYVSENEPHHGTSVATTKKTLVIDFTTIPNGDSNIEGMTFGPKIECCRTLLFVSDNNFEPNTPTRFYLFKLKETYNGTN